MKTKKEKVINYLKEWGGYLNISALERKVGIKPSTLKPFLAGKKYNIDKYVDELHKLFKEMAFCY